MFLDPPIMSGEKTVGIVTAMTNTLNIESTFLKMETIGTKQIYLS